MKKKFVNFISKMYRNHNNKACKYKHVAVITKGGKILSVGFNNMRSHPMAMIPLNVLHTKNEIDKLELRTIHAEMDAIRKIKNKKILSHCEMWVYSEFINGDSRISKPCELCQHYINLYNIKTVYYSTSEGWKTL